MGIKTMLYANGIGPVNKKINIKISKRILQRVDVITLREPASLKELESYNITKPIKLVTADPALTLEKPSVDISHILLKYGIALDSPMVGLSVRNWHDMSNCEDVLAKIADYIYLNYRAQVVFIPFQYEKDIKTVDKICSKMKTGAFIIREKLEVDQIIKIISSLELLIGMRLHSLIYGASMQIPIIGIKYEQKVNGFLDYIGQKSAGDVNSLDYESFKKLLDEVWNNREKVKSQLTEILKEHKEKALENAKIAISLIGDNKNE